MLYLTSFFEGIITFISPCLLPMLPVYLSFFAGGEGERNHSRTLKNALGFVLGFTVVFLLLGVFAGAAGHLLTRHQTVVNLVTGAVVLLFGLNYIGILVIPALQRTVRMQRQVKILGFGSAVLFGIVFAVGWTPCVGVFLGTALAQASQQGSMLRGAVLLLCYSLGLGIPFVASALLLDQMRGAFDFIKRHYRVINAVSGAFLIVMGLLMMTGRMSVLLSMLPL